MFRKTLLIGFAIASMAVATQPASAKERDLGNLAKDDDKLIGICGNHDAEVWVSPDGNNWGCGYKGGGGVLCDKDTGCLEETRTAPDTDEPWGLAGLIGLLGLLGLTRRRRHGRNHDTSPDGRV